MIKILLFAELEEKIGARQIELSEEMPVRVIREKLLAEYPHATGLKSAMVAINEEYAEEEFVPQDGDLVAFIPPVSGG